MIIQQCVVFYKGEGRMAKPIIRVKNLTKDYGNKRGVFNINLQVSEGECYGFLGPNGAGKTTTIRHMMGFSKPQFGKCSILGKDCWKRAAELKKSIGYLPGEVSLPVGVTGEGFLKMILKMHGYSRYTKCQELLERFELDVKKKTREMSLGEKRKVAIAAAFMHDPKILVLDEPTSGLDPVMQQEFIKFIKEEKVKGKTIFLSSHIFSEVDAVCDRIAIIKTGEIVSEFRSEELRQTYDSIYVVKFETKESYEAFKKKKYILTADSEERLKVKVRVPAEQLQAFIEDMAPLHIKSFHQVKFSLEDYFMDFYKSEEVQI